MPRPKHDKSLDTLSTAAHKRFPQGINLRSKSGGNFKYFYDEGDGTYIRTPRASVINAATKPYNWSISKEIRGWIKFIIVDVIGAFFKQFFK